MDGAAAAKLGRAGAGHGHQPVDEVAWLLGGRQRGPAGEVDLRRAAGEGGAEARVGERRKGAALGRRADAIAPGAQVLDPAAGERGGVDLLGVKPEGRPARAVLVTGERARQRLRLERVAESAFALGSGSTADQLARAQPLAGGD